MILEDPSGAALPHRGGDQPRNHPHHGVHQILCSPTPSWRASQAQAHALLTRPHDPISTRTRMLTQKAEGTLQSKLFYSPFLDGIQVGLRMSTNAAARLQSPLKQLLRSPRLSGRPNAGIGFNQPTLYTSRVECANVIQCIRCSLDGSNFLLYG